MATSDEASVSLEYTPTWVVALVCSVIVVISLSVERFLHYLGKALKHKRQNALFEALQKLKEELMLLGFISLLLTVFQNLITGICMPESFTNHMLPCKKTQASSSHLGLAIGHSRRRLLSAGGGSAKCAAKGMVPLLSLEALHQLHIFIFVLAVVHVLFCATTMVLGGLKIQRWKRWEVSVRDDIERMEKEAAAEISQTQPQSHQVRPHPHRHPHLHPHLHHQFVAERAEGFWTRSAVVSWIVSFLKQFHASVTHSDYIALRHGFIMKHCKTNPKFDFHKYMMRTLETDFKKVVGISWYLWLFVVIFLLLNVNGWHTYFWLSFLPLILLLVVGAKLEHIITRLAQNARVDPEGVEVKPSDDYFWLQRPSIVLYLIHFILFQNAFEIAFFFWILSAYGFDSCIMEKVAYIVPRLTIGVLVQVLCSYSTLPLYAIVSQMGEMFKESIFNEQTQTGLHEWLEGVKQRHKKDGGDSGINLPSFLKGISKERSAIGGGQQHVQMRSAGADLERGGSRSDRDALHSIALE